MKGGFIEYLKANKVVRNFILSDLMLFGGWGLIAPVMSVFIVDKIEGATLVTVGATATVYWVIRSVLELPLAYIIEKTESEKDDMYVLISGILLAAVSAFWLGFVKTVPQLFIFYSIQAVGFAFYAASWAGIFSRHIDKNRAALSWSMDHTALGIGTGLTGLIGGLIADKFGFHILFTLVGVFSCIAAAIIFIVPDMILPGRKRSSAEPQGDHSPKETL